LLCADRKDIKRPRNRLSVNVTDASGLQFRKEAQQVEMMNSSDRQVTPRECSFLIFLGGRLDSAATEAYLVVVFVAIMNIITCPFAIVLNALVIVAVHKKRRLKTMSNAAVGCLATTDLAMGVVGQPLFLAQMITILQADASSVNCLVMELPRHAVRLMAGASLLHLALLNVERYIAIKLSYAYIIMVTKSRILCSSALAWIAILFLTIPLAIIDNTIYLTVTNIAVCLTIAIIIFCQVTVYLETRRHKKQIAAQQVSAEARQKHSKEKKAFKLTTTVLLILILTYSPMFVSRILFLKSVIDSVDVAYIAYFPPALAAVLNSLINPVIYCVRIRQFRVSFIEIVLWKNNAQAEELERKVFGTLNASAPHEERQEGDRGQNNEQHYLGNSANNSNNNNQNNNNCMYNNSEANNDYNNSEDNNNPNNNTEDNNSEDNNNDNNDGNQQH